MTAIPTKEVGIDKDRTAIQAVTGQTNRKGATI